MKKLLIVLAIALVLPMVALAAPAEPNCGIGTFEGELLSWEVEVSPGVFETQYEWEGECEYGTSIGLFHILPRFTFTRVVGNTIDYLTSKFMKSRIVCGYESVPFAVNMYGQPFDGTPVQAGEPANTMEGTNYGYPLSVYLQDSEVTYNRVELPFTNVFCRIIGTVFGRDFVSQELKVN